MLVNLPVVYQSDVKGGYHVVPNLMTDDIGSNLKEVGMIAWDKTTNCHYQWNGTNWLAIHLIKKWENGDAIAGQLYLKDQVIYLALRNNTIIAGTDPETSTTDWGRVGDGLGDHIAAKDLKMGNFTISNDGDNTKGLVFDGDGNATFKQDVVVNGNFSTPSDGRLKTNVQLAEGMLGKIAMVHGVSFEYANQQKYAEGTRYGFIAQELQKQFPGMVTKDKDGFYSVDYLQMIAVLLQAINEQQEMINQLIEEKEQAAE